MKLKSTATLDDPIFLAYDVFNISYRPRRRAASNG